MAPINETAASTVKNIKEWIIHAANDVQQRAENFRQNSAGSASPASAYDFSTDDIGMLPVLPSKQDRLLMLRAVLEAADDVEKERTQFASSSAQPSETSIVKSQRERYRIRLNKVLQEQLGPTAASALLLCKPMPKPEDVSGNDDKNRPTASVGRTDGDERKATDFENQQAVAMQEMCNVMASASSMDPVNHLVQDPYECMVLLISNVVLHYGETHGGYDSRVRHVVQRACIDILVRWMEYRLFLEQIQAEKGQVTASTDQPMLQDLLQEAVAITTIFESHPNTDATKTSQGDAGTEAAENGSDSAVSADNSNTAPTAFTPSPDEVQEPELSIEGVRDNANNSQSLDGAQKQQHVQTPLSPAASSTVSATPSLQESESENGFLEPMDPSLAPIPPSESTDVDSFSPPFGMSESNNSASASDPTKQQSSVPAPSQPPPPPTKQQLRMSKRERQKQLRKIAARKFLAMEQTIAGKMAALLLSNFKDDSEKPKRTHSILDDSIDGFDRNSTYFDSGKTASTADTLDEQKRTDTRSDSGSESGSDEDESSYSSEESSSGSSSSSSNDDDDGRTGRTSRSFGHGAEALKTSNALSRNSEASSKPNLIKTAIATTMNPTVENFNQMKDTVAIVAKKQTEQMNLMLIKNKKKIIRGLQVTGVGAVAGTIFAVTGGLAAPAIAAWLAGFGIATGTAASAVVAAVTTSQVVATIFGLGGGGLAAYKMRKRTAGLREFRLRREQIEQTTHMAAPDQILRRGIQASLPQLHTTICISGWVENLSDFQRPWGIQPTDPPIMDPIHLLQRFFTVHDPPRVSTFAKEVKQRQKQERRSFSWDTVFYELENQYGTNPKHTLPMQIPDSQEQLYSLPKSLQGMVSELLEKIVLSKIYINNMDMIEEKKSTGPVEEIILDDDSSLASSMNNTSIDVLSESARSGGDDDDDGDTADRDEQSSETEKNIPGPPGLEMKTFKLKDPSASAATKSCGNSRLKASDFSWSSSTGVDSLKDLEAEKKAKEKQRQKDEWAEQKLLEAAAHQKMLMSGDLDEEEDEVTSIQGADCVVWDWHTLMGGDLHTLTWESEVLSGLSHIVATMATEVTSQTTKQVLGATAVGAIFAAVAIPSALLTASQLIDDPYQIVILRADEAGVELARCLLQSEERRPVSLVGYSFGARVIFSCLTELARHQQLWEYQASLTPQELQKYKRENRHKLLDSDSGIVDYIREPASIVQDVVVMGLPRAVETQPIATARYMAGGRFVNCYSRNDWLLSLMFLARAGTQTCGTHPIENVPGIENYNVSDMVEAHAKYGDAVPKILRLVGPLC